MRAAEFGTRVAGIFGIMKVTAETITDDQIRKLRADLRREAKSINEYDELRADENSADIHTCTIALTDRRAMAYMMKGVAEGVQKARARCAEILTARLNKDKETK